MLTSPLASGAGTGAACATLLVDPSQQQPANAMRACNFGGSLLPPQDRNMLLQLQGYALPPAGQMSVSVPLSGAMDLGPGPGVMMPQQQQQAIFSVGAPGVLLGAQQPLSSVAPSGAPGDLFGGVARNHLAPNIDVLGEFSKSQTQTPVTVSQVAVASVPMAALSQDGATTPKKMALAVPSGSGSGEAESRVRGDSIATSKVAAAEPKTEPAAAPTASSSAAPTTAPAPPPVLVSERRAGISAVNVHLAMSGRLILQACRGRGAQLARAAPNEGSLALSIHPPGEAPPVPPPPPKTPSRAPPNLTPAVPCVTVRLHFVDFRLLSKYPILLVLTI